MDERMVTSPGSEHLPPLSSSVGPPGKAALTDPQLLQILSTEHWSLLSARSLVYNEAFSRAGMFLTFVSASLVALGFAANAMAFSREFLLLAAALVGLDLVIGLATMGRVTDATLDDLRAIHGMNRIRNGYVQIAPEVMPFFVSSIHDDAAGVMATYGEPAEARPAIPAFLHGLTATNGMIGIIVAILPAILAGMIAIVAGGSSVTAFTIAAVTFVVVFVFVVESRYRLGVIRRFEAGLDSRFPTPSAVERR